MCTRIPKGSLISNDENKLTPTIIRNAGKICKEESRRVSIKKRLKSQIHALG